LGKDLGRVWEGVCAGFGRVTMVGKKEKKCFFGQDATIMT